MLTYDLVRPSESFADTVTISQQLTNRRNATAAIGPISPQQVKSKPQNLIATPPAQVMPPPSVEPVTDYPPTDGPAQIW